MDEVSPMTSILGPYRIPLWTKSSPRLPFWDPTESRYELSLPHGFHSGTLQNPSMDKVSLTASILGPYRIPLWMKSPPRLPFWDPTESLYG